jgi:serine O-acetyltransferase
MKEYIKADLFRYGGLTGFSGILKGLRMPGFRYTLYMRILSQSKRYSLTWLVFSIMIKRNSHKYGFQIPFNSNIGEGFYLGHFGTVVINAAAIIGKNCTLTHNVTIGQANRGDKTGCPTIGDNVWIGTGAVIVGKIQIGSNVLIAPNTYINQNIPDNSIAIGNPCKIISKENPCEGYINFTLK